MSAVTRFLKSFLGEPTTQPARRNPAPKLGMERLEAREVPAVVTAQVVGGELVIQSDGNASNVRIVPYSTSQIQVVDYTNQFSRNIPAAGVTTVVFHGGGRNDQVECRVDLPLRAYGGDGDDYFVGGSRNDTMLGGYGADTLYGGPGDDTLDGGDDNDGVYGESGNDTVYGGAGNDILRGNEGNDTVNGGWGDDSVGGNEGDDVLIGGGDSDILNGSIGNDTMYGGSGNDTLDGSDGNDTILGDDGDDTIYGSDGDDTLRGNVGSDTIYGGYGLDNIRGNEGDDFLYGDANRDSIRGDEGQDVIYGGSGVDTLDGGEGNDTILGDDGDDTIYGSYGDDVLRGNLGEDFIYGGPGADNIRGNGGDDRLYGDSGDDFIRGDEENDLMDGGSGSDSLYGGTGRDVLSGIVGEDVLSGGAENDTLNVTFDVVKLYTSRGKFIVPLDEYLPGAGTGSDTVNVDLELGSFFANTVAPVVASVQGVTQRFQPLVTLLQQPVVDAIDPTYTYARLLADAGYPQVATFVDVVSRVNALNPAALSGTYRLGTAQVSADRVTAVGANALRSLPVWGGIQQLTDAGLNFPVLQDPAAAVKLLIGQDVDLFTFDLPELSGEFRAERSYTVWTNFGPVSSVFYAVVTVAADAQFGVDTAGFGSGVLLDGFFARNVTGSFALTVGVDGGYGVPDVFFVGVGGAVTGAVGFTLVDPNADGKIRLSELSVAPAVTTTGTLTVRLYAFREEYDVLPRWIDGDGTGTDRDEYTFYERAIELW